MSSEPAIIVPEFPPLLTLNRGGKIITSLPQLAVPFTPCNQAQFDYIQAGEPFVFLCSNRGAGKSITARAACHALAMAYPGYRYGILRTSYPELIKNHLIFLSEEMKALGGTYHTNDHIAHYPNGSKGFYMQAETENQVRNALGVEMFCVVFDEAPTFQWEHMVMIAASVRVPIGSGLVAMKRFLGNPIGPCIDELWKRFVDKDVDPLEDPEYRPDEWRVIFTDHRDNKHLDVEQYRRSLGAGLPEHIRKAWLDGERVPEGQLFEVFKTKRNAKGVEVPYHIIHELPEVPDPSTPGKMVPIIRFNAEKGEWEHPPWVRIYRAFDNGYWPDPSICLWFIVFGKRIICFKEKVWYRHIAQQVAQDIVAESKGMRVSMTYADPTISVRSGHGTSHDIQSIKDIIESNGVPIELAVNDRALYAHAIRTLLAEEVETLVPKMQLYQPGCPYTSKYLPQMRYDEKNPLAMADHKHDHGPCCIAYFGMNYMPNAQPPPLPTNTGRWMRPKKGARPAIGRANVRH